MPRFTPATPLLATLVLVALAASPPRIAAEPGPANAKSIDQEQSRSRGAARRMGESRPGVRAGWTGGVQPGRLDAALRNLDASSKAQGLIRAGRDGNEWVSVFVRGSVTTEALRAAGADVQTDVGELRTARVPISLLPAVMQLPGVERMSLGWQVEPHLDISVVEANIDTKRTSEPPLYGWNGRNVVVGIVDSGFDYQHQDFRTPSGTTRFLNIWDQNVAGTPPAGFGYGNVCTQAQINAGTCSETDVDGHGTHVLGIAGGDGSAAGNFEPPFIYVGVANNANLIGVATDYSFQGVVDGVNYVFQRAAALGMPAVVNLSLGTTLGSHDGKSDFEFALNALTGPGKVIVSSGGNSQNTLEHASADVTTAGGDVNFTFTVPSYTASPSFPDFVALDFWHSNANSYQVRVKRPSSASLVGNITKGAPPQTFNTTDGTILIDYSNGSDPYSTGSSEIYIEINDNAGTPPRGGSWYVQLHPVSTPGTPRVHGWMDSFLGGGVAFGNYSALLDTTINVSSPGNADSLVTVAAYTTKRFWASVDGQIYNFTGSVNPYQIAPFSSRGPRRDGAQKPDITAGGAVIGSTLSADSSPPWPVAQILPDEQHLILQGTSMAAPQVTGAIALLMQKYPTLTPSGAKQALGGAARSDGVTGAVPNPRWGRGKLDLNALLCDQTDIPTVSVTYPNPGETLFGNTRIGLNWLAFDAEGVQKIDLHYRLGYLGAWQTIALNELNDFYYDWMVPSVTTDSLQLRVLAYDCVETNFELSAFHRVRPASTGTETDIPSRFALSRPSPNPFVESAAVRFDLPAAPGGGKWPVEVSIYNVAGRRVRVLVREERSPGRYVEAWDGRDDGGAQLAAGVYFVHVKAGANDARDRLVYLP